ncbi:MAG: hypothetical protein CSA81_10690 [Acidobacteria bacterium]|nr:MAG: hypothetical protein CSA81_10690 [Acidobacteriota bacterium]PIE89900.1 MAG: hypothetical protein CR997_08775 [Acidobacteriota bacterium]
MSCLFVGDSESYIRQCTCGKLHMRLKGKCVVLTEEELIALREQINIALEELEERHLHPYDKSALFEYNYA